MKQTKFRVIYILDSKAHFHEIEGEYQSDKDLILTFDFWVKKHIEAMSGSCEYIDHLLDPKILHQENHAIYEYFRKWNLRSDGTDVLQYRNIPFGMSLRQEIWNDFTFYIRCRLAIDCLSAYSYTTIVSLTNMPLLKKALAATNVEFRTTDVVESDSYYFPIFRWNTSVIVRSSLKAVFRRQIDQIIARVQKMIDHLPFRKKKSTIFVQPYHPTTRIIESLSSSPDNRLVVQTSNIRNPSRIFRDVLIPFRRMNKAFKRQASVIIDRMIDQCRNRLVLRNRIDVTEEILEVFVECMRERLPHYIRTLDGIVEYFEKNELKLEILIANLGITSSLIDSYCRAKSIPSYLIINGLLGQDYLDEGKYASVINSYSTSIKENYFAGMDNIVCLGDPRMDEYHGIVKNINRLKPTVTIGTSGYNPIDLNSYLAVEFDFLFDVLTALSTSEFSESMRIVLKIRPNGYRTQYEAFVSEYFSEMDIELIDNQPMKTVLMQTDFYITIYSQTLFEASTLGIPVVYYKKDTEFNQTPFDGTSELVTANTISELTIALRDFIKGSSRYDDFLDNETMEKYIGPLDGRNLERNLELIHKLLKSDGDMTHVMARQTI